MTKPIALSNGRSWKNQTVALDHFKQMLRRYGDEELVGDPMDHEDLVALLERYDGAITGEPSKIGSGINQFFRRLNRGERFSTPSFWVRRTDGSETDFSYIAAVKGQPKSEASEFYDACRAAVAADLVAAKKRFFSENGDENGRVRCDISGVGIDYDQARLSHAAPPFIQLVVAFRAKKQWQKEIPPGVLTMSADQQTMTQFAAPDVALEFRKFHSSSAVLRIVDTTTSMPNYLRSTPPACPIRLTS